jgi:hypothetical protein
MRWHTSFLVVTALAVASAVVGVGGFAAEGANATKASLAKDKVKAKITDGVLIVTGTGGDDSITLALAAGDSTTLLVEAGADTLSFKRDKFQAIVVDAGNGDDLVSIDEAKGGSHGHGDDDPERGERQRHAPRRLVHGEHDRRGW